MTAFSIWDLVVDVLLIFGVLVPLAITTIALLVLFKIIEPTEVMLWSVVLFLNTAMMARTGKTFHMFNRDRSNG